MNVKEKLKQVIVDGMNLEDVRPEQIADDTPLFGAGLELDSLDAVELVILVQSKFGVEIKDMDEGREAFRTIESLASFIEKRRPG